MPPVNFQLVFTGDYAIRSNHVAGERLSKQVTRFQLLQGWPRRFVSTETKAFKYSYRQKPILLFPPGILQGPSSGEGAIILTSLRHF